jgi:hypothetical protein
MKGLIEYVCTAHQEPDGVGPKITIRENAWALCPGHGEDDHEWVRIAPTPRGEIGDVDQVRRSQAS